jgi:hypothetical protein
VLPLSDHDQACTGRVMRANLSSFGYKQDQAGKWQLRYNFEENIQRIQKQLQSLVKGGCGCKTDCKTKACGCRKADRTCSKQCRCVGCTNTGQAVAGGEGSDDIWAQAELEGTRPVDDKACAKETFGDEGEADGIAGSDGEEFFAADELADAYTGGDDLECPSDLDEDIPIGQWTV